LSRIIQPTFDQIFQQRLAGRSVLGRSFSQSQRVFGAIHGDPDRRQHHVPGEVHSVDQQRHQLEPAQIALHQFG
jgi:hypothetical protein